MKNNVTLLLSRFNTLRDTTPQPTTWNAVVTEIASNKHEAATRHYREACVLLKEAEANGYTARVEELKQQKVRLKNSQPAFIPSVTLQGGRAAVNILSYTGLMMVDIDEIAPERLDEVLSKVRADKYVFLVHVTMSGVGIRVIASVDVEITKQNFGKVWQMVNDYYARLTGIAVDRQCKNATRMSVLCYDPEVLYNPDAEPMPVSLWLKQAKEVAAATPKRKAGRPVKVEKAAPTVQRLVEEDGIQYAPGSHNAYISRCLYWMNRFGVAEADAQRWALCEFADYDRVEHSVAATVRSCYALTGEHGTCKLSDFAKRGEGQSGRPSSKVSVEEMEAFVRNWGEFRMNRLINQLEFRRFNPPSCHSERSEESVNIHRSINPPCEGGTGDVPSAWEDKANGTSPWPPSQGGVVGVNEILRRSAPLNDNAESATALCHSDIPLCHSERSEESEYTHDEEWQRMTDREENSLWRAMQHAGLDVDVFRIRTLLQSDFVKDHYPLQEYLERLPPWDGQADYIGQLAGMVHCKDTSPEEFASYFQRWLVGILAGALRNDTTNHVIFVLVGTQGIYKSTFMKHILPPELRRYYQVKINSQRMDKDDVLAVTENLLINFEELDTMQRSELGQVKALCSDDYINQRPAYARNKVYLPHVASFCGTGNNLQFLTDDSGNRRWLPFEVVSIDDPRKADIPYEGIYAQAKALLDSGRPYWFDQKEIDELNTRNRRFEAPNPARELVSTFYRKPLPSDRPKYITASMIVARFGGTIRLSAVQVGRVLKDLGFEQVLTHHGRFWAVIERTQDEINHILPTSATDATDATDVF